MPLPSFHPLAVGAFLALWPLALPAQEAPEPEIRTYDVSGATSAALQASLERNGPGKAIGRTNYEWKYSFSYRRQHGAYRISDVKVSTHVSILMPKWTDRDAASQCLRDSWDRLYDNLRRHERQHVELGADVAGRIRDALQTIPPKSDEKALKEAAREAASEIIAQNEVANRKFDERTDHGRSDPDYPVVLKHCP